MLRRTRVPLKPIDSKLTNERGGFFEVEVILSLVGGTLVDGSVPDFKTAMGKEPQKTGKFLSSIGSFSESFTANFLEEKSQ